MGRHVRRSVTALAMLLFASLATEARASFDVAKAVSSCETKEELIQLIGKVRKGSPGDPELAKRLARHLSGGSRWFLRDGRHWDPIDEAKSSGKFVVFKYRRDGKRWGYAEVSAHRVGRYVVLVGDWWQQSKMHGGSFATPPIGKVPSIGVPYGKFFKDDHGGSCYVFKETSTGFRSVNGTGIDFGDHRTLRYWLLGGNGA